MLKKYIIEQDMHSSFRIQKPKKKKKKKNRTEIDIYMTYHFPGLVQALQ
jgi:hypothetical protein